MIEIPLSALPEQTFNTVINGENYNFRVLLNSRLSIWTLDLSQNEIDIILGIPLVGGVDIFSPFNIPIENVYVVNLDNPKLDPSKLNLGTVAKLFILSNEEITNG